MQTTLAIIAGAKMPSQDARKARLENMYRADPICPECKRMTFLPKDLAQLFGADITNPNWIEKIPDSCRNRMATRDHLYPRSDYRRKLPKRGPLDVRTRLLCSECNIKRGDSKLEGWKPEPLPKLGILLEVI